jgi:hypothetical protein
MMEVIYAFAGGALISALVCMVLMAEANRQWRREFHKQRLDADAMLSEIWAAVTDRSPVDPGENAGGPVEGVQVGVGEFYHLKDVELVDVTKSPRWKTFNLLDGPPLDANKKYDSLAKPIPAQERTNTNG